MKILLKKPQPIIVIDGVFFQLNNTGIARVWHSLLKTWSQSDFAGKIIVLDRGNTVPHFANLTYKTIDLYDYRYSAQDSVNLQAICDEVGASIFISTYYTTPLTTPSVFMAYDFVPEVLGFDLDDPSWQEKQQAILHANHYLAISHNTAQDLTRLFPFVSPEMVTVAYCGVDETLIPAKPQKIETFRQQYQINSPYFLVVGSRLSLKGYKNAILLFKALSEYSNTDGISIVCVGGNRELEPELRKLAEDIPVYLLQLDDSELKYAYSGAISLVYPSLYEGFGLPIAEAMACGCPVITCRNSSIPEVAGDAAIYVDENKIKEMILAIEKVKNPDIRQKLITKGLEQARQFSWQKMANTVSETLITTANDYIQNQQKYDQKLLIWQELRKTKQELQEKEAKSQRLSTHITQLQLENQRLSTLASRQKSLPWLNPMLSSFLGFSLLLFGIFAYFADQWLPNIPLNAFDEPLLIIVYNPTFTLSVSLLSVALMLSMIGYWGIIPSKPLRLIRIILLSGGLMGFGLMIFRTFLPLQ